MQINAFNKNGFCEEDNDLVSCSAWHNKSFKYSTKMKMAVSVG